MFLRGDFWHYDFISGGDRFRGSTGFKKNEKDKAKEAEDRLKVQVRDKHSIEMIWEQTKRKLISYQELDFSFDVLWGAYVKRTSSVEGKKRTQIKQHRLRHFCDWVKENHPETKKISMVDQKLVQEWWNQMRNGDGSTSTKNDFLFNVKTVFKTIGKDSGIVEDPFQNIKKLKNDSPARESFTPEELAIIGKNAKGWIYSLCITAISTGLREGDICMLEKASVDLDSGWISIQKTRKTGVSVEVPIMPGLKRHLQLQFEENPEDKYVFPDLAKQYLNNSSRIGAEIKKFFEEIGISNTKREVSGYKRVLSNKDVHSFRHTFVYLASCHGIPFPIVQGIVGHASPEMTKHYMNHAGRQEKEKYLHQLPDYLTGMNVGNDIETREVMVLRKRLAEFSETLTGPSLERTLLFIKTELLSDPLLERAIPLTVNSISPTEHRDPSFFRR